MSRILSVFEHVVRTTAAQLPLPGGGDTWARFEALSKWAAQDLSLDAQEDMELRVITSGRRQARAPLGFAHALSSFDEDLRNSELIA